MPRAPLTPEAVPPEVSLGMSAAAHLSWFLTENRTKRTAPAREAFDQKFLDAAGGDPVRAAHLRKAFYKSLALKSAQARRRNRAAGGGAA